MNRKIIFLVLLLVLVIAVGYSASQKYFNQRLVPVVSPAPVDRAAPVMQNDSQVIEKIDTMEETEACDENKSPSPQPSTTPHT